jgi:hypothetical protein
LAVRLHLKLGVVTEQERRPDSPDTIMIVEQSVGSVARTKGHLYLLVCSRVPGPRAREATRQVAETIRNEYYYDESAGIRGCLIKTIGLANKRLAHHRDRYGLGTHGEGGPIGIAVAVVRGSELYVATVGPAEAYLIRQARLSTLPDPHRERGLPADELEPDVWRGELTVGDSLCLVSANLVARIGTDVLKDALVTLHPQPAVEHLHSRFMAADGQGSDAALAIEATEVAATHRTRTLVPVRPAEPLAGTPDRSPIPLADTVTGGVAALGAGATRARSAAGTMTERAVWRLQDLLLPKRHTAYRRVTPATTRMETQRRAAVAVLAFVAVAASLGVGVYAFGGQREPAAVIESLSTGQQALTTAQKALNSVSGPGVDLVRDEPKKAMTLLTTAFEQLDIAAASGVPRSTIDPLRSKAVKELDRLYGVVPVRSATLFTFDDAEVPVELTALVLGPDNAPYVLDSGSNTVWRIDLAERKATAVVREGQKASGTNVDVPKFITVGGPDLLVLDAKNVLWRWRPANDDGKGTLGRIKVAESSSWGDDILAIGTFVANFNAGLYRLYVVDPSQQQILNHSPASDGGGFPAKPSGRLPAARPVDGVTDLMIDGDIFTAENGVVLRVIPAEGWRAKDPGDSLLREPPRYTRIATATARRSGALYAFDDRNDRIVAINKSDGAYIEQFRLAGGDRGWRDLRGMVIVPPVDEGEPFTLWWISRDRLHSVPLERVEDVPPPPTPRPTASPEGEDPSATPEGD